MLGLVVLGTRPEAIKLIPLIQKCFSEEIPLKILSTEQHFDAVQTLFSDNHIKIDYRLVPKKYPDLVSQTTDYLSAINSLINDENFDFIISQGDTISAYVGMLYAYLSKIDYLYIESGLRTNDFMNPFPEEGLRTMMSHIARMNFVPTKQEQTNLELEGIDNNKIKIVGNTGIDYLINHMSNQNVNTVPKSVLITIHRRENWPHLHDFFYRLAEYAKKRSDVTFVYPIHFNPEIQRKAYQLLSNIPNIRIEEPLVSEKFYTVLSSSEMIITDSGGVQEEATYLNKKVVIIRDKIERLFLSKCIKQVSITDKHLFITINDLLEIPLVEKPNNLVYGDGFASERIVEWIKEEYRR